MPLPQVVSDVVRDLFARPPVLAVLGAHPGPFRAAHYVPDYLLAHGARVLPVNPRYAGVPLFGEPCLENLDAAAAHPLASGGLDAVVVFRASSALAGHQAELLRVAPRVVWFQQGIRDDSVADALRAAGINVVQDRCLKVDHARVMGF